MFISGYTNTENIFYYYGSDKNTGFICILKVLAWVLEYKSRLESPWKLQSGLESPWISVLNLSNPANTKKPWGWNFAHVVEELKKRLRLKALLCTEWSPWPVGNVLESPWKVLEFLVQKRIHANPENSKLANTFLYLLIYNLILFSLMLILV